MHFFGKSSRSQWVNNYSNEHMLDMRWKITNKVHSTKLAITILYPKSASGIIVLLKTHKELQYLSSPAVLCDMYTYHIKYFVIHMVYEAIKTQKLQ